MDDYPPYPPELDTADWQAAFNEAEVDPACVSEVLAMAEGENDGDNWVGVFRTKGGAFLYVTAGCDYTGWDCQASGSHETRRTLEQLVRECCTDDDRRRLGLQLGTDVV